MASGQITAALRSYQVNQQRVSQLAETKTTYDDRSWIVYAVRIGRLRKVHIVAITPISQNDFSFGCPIHMHNAQ